MPFFEPKINKICGYNIINVDGGYLILNNPSILAAIYGINIKKKPKII